MRSNDAGRWALSVLVFVAAANGVAWLFYALRSEDPSGNGPGTGGQVAMIVPDVAGQDYESAKRALEAAGFDVALTSDPTGGRVKEQTPAARKRIRLGENKTVTLTLETLVADLPRIKKPPVVVSGDVKPKPVLPSGALTGKVLVLLLQTEEAVKSDQAALLQRELDLLKQKLGGNLLGGKVYPVKDAANKPFPSARISETFAAAFREIDNFARDPKVVNPNFKTVFVWLTNTSFSFEALGKVRAELEKQKQGRTVYIAYWHSQGEASDDLPTFLDRTCRVDNIKGLANEMCQIFSLEPQRTP
jgi:hypothetical protein